MNIQIISCGGTIDKVYFDAKSSYQVGEPAAISILSRAGVDLPPPVSVCKKDSLEMDERDRDAVSAAISASDFERFLICHGTDTMSETARHVAAVCEKKTAVFVGSFLPAVFRETDADFNIGFALSAARLLPFGAYIAMNGEVFKAEEVRKNREAGRFERGGDS